MFNGEHRECVQLAVKAPKGSSRKRIKGYIWAVFVNGEMNERCIVDTGAEVTTIPHRIWSMFMTHSEVLRLPQRILGGVGGGVVKAGETTLQLGLTGLGNMYDVPHDLGPCTVWLAFDNEAAKPMRQVLLGVGGGTLDKGGLCINWKEEKVYYIEVDDIAP